MRGPTGHQESRCSERFPKQLEPKSGAQKEKQNTTHFANIKIQDFCLLKNSTGKNTFYSNLRRNMNEYIKNFWKCDTTVTSVRKEGTMGYKACTFSEKQLQVYWTVKQDHTF